MLNIALLNTSEPLLVSGVNFQKLKMPLVMILVSSLSLQSMERKRPSTFQEKAPLLVTDHHKYCTYNIVEHFIRISVAHKK